MGCNDVIEGSYRRREASDEFQSEALNGVWSVYYRRGFKDGHRQAVQDVLGSVMTVSEEFLGSVGGSDALRRLIYAFERNIEHRIEEIARRADSGGAARPPPPEVPAPVPPS